MSQTSNEQAGNIYFGIFLIMAIIGGWVMWRSNAWYEAAARQQVVAGHGMLSQR